MKKITLLSIPVAFLLMQSCTTVRHAPVTTLPGYHQSDNTTSSLRKVRLGKTVESPLKLIAEDMVNALSQILQLTPNSQSIGIPVNRSGFDTAVGNLLKERGYDTIDVEQRSGSNRIITSTLPSREGTNEVTLVLAINQIALKRTYEIKQNYVRPLSALYVRGHSVDQIRLDDRIFVAEFKR